MLKKEGEHKYFPTIWLIANSNIAMLLFHAPLSNQIIVADEQMSERKGREKEGMKEREGERGRELFYER